MGDMPRSSRPKLGRNFGLLWSGSVFSLVGTVNTTVAVPLVALALTGSAFYAGLAGFAGALPRLLLQIPAGFIADRVDRRKVMVLAQAGRYAVAATLGLVLWFQVCTIWLLIGGIALEGVFAACFEITEISIIPQIVRRRDFNEATARNEGRNFVATLAGRPLGGVLYALGSGFPFLAAAGSTLVSAALLARLGRKEQLVPLPERVKNESLREQAAVGFQVLRADPLLRRTVVICAVTNFLFQIVGLNLVVVAEKHDLSPVYIGVLLAASGAGGLLGAWLAPRILEMAAQPGRTVLLCMMSWCGALWLFVVVDVPVSWLFAWALVGFTGSQLSVLRARHQATVVAPERLGLVAGFNQFLTQGAVMPVALLLSGGAIAAVGTTVIAIFTAVVATALMLMMFVRGWHRLLWSDSRLHRPGQASINQLCPESSSVSMERWSSGSVSSLRSSRGRVLSWLYWRPSRPRPSASWPPENKSDATPQLVNAGRSTGV
jgi:MFS family permease